jgi:hypothetical protein
VDPALEPSALYSPALRDSAYQFGPFLARSAHRQYAAANWAAHYLGLLPARDIQH